MGNKIAKLVVFALVLAVFLISGRGTRTPHDFFVPLANSFLQGRLYVPEMKEPLHEMVSDQEVRTGIYDDPQDGERGRFYVIYPPMPAVLLMPFAMITGETTNQSLISILLASLGAVVAYSVFAELKLKKEQVWWMTALYAFGSMLWFHAIVGSAWYFASVCGLLFLWLAILATLRRQAWWIMGAYLGLAYLSRFPLILSLPFFLYYRRDEWWGRGKWLRPLVQFGVVLSIMVGASLFYNYIRYGRSGNYGYTLLEKRWYNVANEYGNGSYDLSYAGRHIEAMLTAMPENISGWPYLVPDLHSLAFWIAFPALFLILRAPWKSPLVRASGAAILLILPSHWLHGGVGATQFGYRYALDYMPFLLLIIAEAIRNKWDWRAKGLFIFSLLTNLWGIYTIFWLS